MIIFSTNKQGILADITIGAIVTILVNVAVGNGSSAAANLIRCIPPENAVSESGPRGITVTNNPAPVTTGLILSDSAVGDGRFRIVLAADSTADTAS